MNRISLAAIIICATLIAAIFAPWANALGGIVSVSITQGEDAPFLIAMAVGTGLLFWLKPYNVTAPIIGILTAIFMAIEVVYTFGLIQDAKQGLRDSDIFGESAASLVSPGWGIYLGAITALALFVVSIAMFVKRKELREQEQRRQMAEPLVVQQ